VICAGTVSSKCETSGWFAQLTRVPIVALGSEAFVNRAIVSVGSKMIGSRMSWFQLSVFEFTLAGSLISSGDAIVMCAGCAVSTASLIAAAAAS
jgi:hypothetical protein